MTNIIDGLTGHTYEGHTVRSSVSSSGEPLFIAKDVCEILEIQNVSQALQGLDEDEKGVCNTDTLGGVQKLLAVTDSGLYALSFASRKPEAKRFRKWVTSEVLPALRKQGFYRLALPGTLRQIDKLRLRLEATELRARAQALEAMARGNREAAQIEGGVGIQAHLAATLPHLAHARLRLLTSKVIERLERAGQPVGWLRQEQGEGRASTWVRAARPADIRSALPSADQALQLPGLEG